MPKSSDHAARASGKPVSSSDATRAHDQLRKLVLTGDLAPGTRLRIGDTAARLGMSAIPVREALNRLSRERLVAYEEQRGFSVAPASAEDFEQLTLARTWNYKAALEDSIRHGGAEWEESVLVHQHRLGKVPRYVEMGGQWVANPEYDAPHKAFHLALIGACRSRWMLSICGDLFDYAVRYQHLARRVELTDREPEHVELAQLALCRDVPNALLSLERHFAKTRNRIVMAESASTAAIESPSKTTSAP